MKTNLLTLLIFVIASVLYSCTKESDDNYPPVDSQSNRTALNIAQRRIIISNCASHSGCHSSSRIMQTGTMGEIMGLMKKSIEPAHNLSVCDRSKMQLWFNCEVNQ
jgi:hypothetical protein